MLTIPKENKSKNLNIDDENQESSPAAWATNASPSRLPETPKEEILCSQNQKKRRYQSAVQHHTSHASAHSEGHESPLTRRHVHPADEGVSVACDKESDLASTGSNPRSSTIKEAAALSRRSRTWVSGLRAQRSKRYPAISWVPWLRISTHAESSVARVPRPRVLRPWLLRAVTGRHGVRHVAGVSVSRLWWLRGVGSLRPSSVAWCASLDARGRQCDGERGL